MLAAGTSLLFSNIYFSPKDNRPFPSCLSPLFQNEAQCEAFHMKFSFIHMQILVIYKRTKLISIWKASH